MKQTKQKFIAFQQRTAEQKRVWLRDTLKRISQGVTILELSQEERVTRQAISLRLHTNPLDEHGWALSSAYRSGAQKRREEFIKDRLKPKNITCRACGVVFTHTLKQTTGYVPVTCGAIECLRWTTGQQKIVYDISIPEVIKLKRSGLSWRAIARQFGYDTQTAASVIMQRIDNHEKRHHIPQKNRVVMRRPKGEQ